MSVCLIQHKKCRLVLSLLMFSLLPFVYSASAHAVNDQMIMIVAYDGTSWSPYVATLSADKKIKRQSWKKIKLISNPVSITRQSGTGDYFVKKDNGEVVRYQSGDKSKLTEVPLPSLASDKTNYTQLRAYPDGVLAIQLYEGKSRQTDIVNIATLANQHRPLINQAAAQFHPLQTQNSLFYGHVSCRLACEPVIQEVWRRNLVSGKTQQLTLLNSTTYLHSVDRNEQFAYISSNQSGYYRLGRLDLSASGTTWLTDGQITDSYPSITDDDALYFIRRDQQGTRLIMLPQANIATTVVNTEKLKMIPLPKGIKKIRYLEISDQ